MNAAYERKLMRTRKRVARYRQRLRKVIRRWEKDANGSNVRVPKKIVDAKRYLGLSLRATRHETRNGPKVQRSAKARLPTKGLPGLVL